MIRYGAIGTSFREGPSAHQARFHIPDEEVDSALQAMREECGFDEVVYLATCNRVELFFAVAGGADDPRFLDRVLSYFAGRSVKPFDEAEVRDQFHAYAGIDAIRHTFKVAASLDSMVIGEAQILGQTKDAYLRSLRASHADAFLVTLFEYAFRVAKRVRTTTGLGGGTVSMASLASHAVRDSGQTRDASIIFVGSGEMIHKCSNHLATQGYSRMTFVNRRVEKVESMAERHAANALSLDTYLERLPETDTIVTATSAPSAIFTAEALDHLLEEREPDKPLVLIDLAVPHDVDPALADDDRVTLVAVDELRAMSTRHLNERKECVEAADAIVESELDAFRKRLAARLTAPSAGILRDEVVEAGRSEVGRLLQGTLRHLSDDDKATIREWAEMMSQRVARIPITKLKALTARCGCENMTAPCLLAAHDEIFTEYIR